MFISWEFCISIVKGKGAKGEIIVYAWGVERVGVLWRVVFRLPV